MQGVRSDERLPDAGNVPIAELAERIDAFRQARSLETGGNGQASARSFRWETGPEGVIAWVEGAPRSALIGQTIASAAPPGGFGAGKEAASAFGRCVPFRDVPFTVAGIGPASGRWCLSGVPFFDGARGHFLGYRGTARRPAPEEEQSGVEPAEEAPGLFGTELAPDALRQLIHELRTPLNAIMGFAEMIDGQYLGPAAEGYRARASRIREQAGQLLAAVDDLDTAARIETQRMPEAEQSAVDAAALLHRLHDGHERVAQKGAAALTIETAPDLPLAALEPDAVERMLSRLLAATIGLAEEGEVLNAAVALEKQSDGEMLVLSLGRPRSLRNVDEARLLDPGYMPPGYWPSAPSLGLGFTLRLVRNLAEAAGGRLAIEEDRVALALPPLS